MNSKRLSLSIIALLVAICTFVGPSGPVGAEASEVHLPIVGRQFITIGPEVRGGPVLDWREDDLDTSLVLGPRARIGIHHILGERLSMNLEVSAGSSYFADHPMAPGGNGDSQFAFDSTVAMLGRYMAIGPTSGLTFAGGVHYRWAALRAGSLLQFGVDGRLGYNIWTSDERFLIIELGLHVPLFEGISASAIQPADELPDEQNQIPDQWTLPSASLGIQWAF